MKYEDPAHSLSNHERNQFYLPSQDAEGVDEGESVMDLQLHSQLQFSVSETEMPEGENPEDYMLDSQQKVGEDLSAALRAKLDAISQEKGYKFSSAWWNCPLPPTHEQEGWEIKVSLKAHIQGDPIKPNLLQKAIGKISEAKQQENQANQEEQVANAALELKEAFAAVIADHSSAFAPLVLGAVSDESEINYSAELSFSNQLDARLGSQTGHIPLS